MLSLVDLLHASFLTVCVVIVMILYLSHITMHSQLVYPQFSLLKRLATATPACILNLFTLSIFVFLESLESLGGLQLPRHENAMRGRSNGSLGSPGLTPTSFAMLVSPNSVKKNSRLVQILMTLSI